MSEGYQHFYYETRQKRLILITTNTHYLLELLTCELTCTYERGTANSSLFLKIAASSFSSNNDAYLSSMCFVRTMQEVTGTKRDHCSGAKSASMFALLLAHKQTLFRPTSREVNCTYVLLHCSAVTQSSCVTSALTAEQPI